MRARLVFFSSTLPCPTLKSCLTPFIHRRFHFLPKRISPELSPTSIIRPFASVSPMASSFHPEKARVPPSIPAPTPPITKVIALYILPISFFFFSSFCLFVFFLSVIVAYSLISELDCCLYSTAEPFF